MQRSSVTEYLDNFLRLGRDIAYVHKRGYRTLRWSYRQTAEVAFQFARELEARGIGPGDRVLLWGENCAEWVAAFLGCLLRGAIAVPMDRTASVDFALRVHQQVDARLAVVSSDLIKASRLTQNVLELESLAEAISLRSKERYRPIAATPDDTVEIIFTSGTTAEPKGVVISHRNILASLVPLETEIAKYIKYERIFHPIRFLNLLPLSHVFGQFLLSGCAEPQRSRRRHQARTHFCGSRRSTSRGLAQR
jgi:long-chain acyl-CoA synthetase